MKTSIVLSAPEVSALLAGATQVRVPVRLPQWAARGWSAASRELRLDRISGVPVLFAPCSADTRRDQLLRPPYRVGSVLAVRECRSIKGKNGGTIPMWWTVANVRVLEVHPELHEGRWYWALRVERTEVGR